MFSSQHFSLTGVLKDIVEQGFEDADQLCAKHRMSIEQYIKKS